MKKKAKALALLSGGLDSRLAVKLMQEQADVNALFFHLPFGSGCCMPECAFNFAQVTGVKLMVIDCTKGKNFRDYLSMVKKPRHRYGTAMNPCVDCRIFMLKKAKALMKKLGADFIVTGDVLNERPMSQKRKALTLIDKEAKLEGKILRPLSAKLLDKTEAEKKGLIDRDKLLSISGRSRKRQIALAKKLKISYPTPAGGCLLCEKSFVPKLKNLFEHKELKDITEKDISLLKLGRHFRYKNNKIIVGRNEAENKMLLELKGNDLVFEVKDFPSPITLLQGKASKKVIEIVASLTLAHSDARHLKAADVCYGKKLEKKINVSSLSRNQIEKLRI